LFGSWRIAIAGWYTRPVEKVGGQADDAFNVSLIDERAANISLSISAHKYGRALDLHIVNTLSTSIDKNNKFQQKRLFSRIKTKILTFK
jgi:hypothetical protein